MTTTINIHTNPIYDTNLQKIDSQSDSSSSTSASGSIIITSSNMMPINSHKDEKICFIIAKFCDSLVKFAQYVNAPTVNSTTKIQGKKTRDFSFDLYVKTTSDFNNIIYKSLEGLKQVIISLHAIFLNRSVDDLMNFLEKLRIFLLFLLTEHVFDDLYNLQIVFNNIYKKDINIMSKISSMKGLLFKICNLSIDITSTFIPPISIFKDAIIILEKKTEENLANRIRDDNNDKIAIDHIIRELNRIQFNMELMTDKKLQNIYKCLIDEKAITITRTIENLETEYIELLHLTNTLKAEIVNYNNRRKNVLLSFIQKIF